MQAIKLTKENAFETPLSENEIERLADKDIYIIEDYDVPDYDFAYAVFTEEAFNQTFRIVYDYTNVYSWFQIARI